MELTKREKEVLKSILETELLDADSTIEMNENKKDRAELKRFYDVVRRILEKLGC